MPSKLGLHWIRTHPDNRDFDHVAKMQYRSVKTFEWMHDNRDFCANLLAALPRDSYILARNHPRSEEKQDVWNDPVGTGNRHADAWADDLRNGRCFLPTDRTFFLGANELDATTGDRNAIDLYTATFLERLQVHGLRGGAFNFSTGHPRTVDGTANTAADYSVFERSHAAIVKGHHVGVLHIYGTSAQPCVPGHFDRLKACTWNDVEWVVGECGPDEHVVGGGKHDGYLISMASNPSALCAWLDTLIVGVNDKRIHSYQVFTYDFSHPWDSFDTRPIRDALENHQWRHMIQQPPTPDAPPTTPTTSTIAYVKEPIGANLRTQPNTTTGQIITAVAFGEQIRILGVMDTSGWFRVRFGDKEGYMASSLVSLTPPEPAPQPSEGPTPIDPPPAPEPKPTPTGIIAPLVAQAILRIESGGRTHGENGKVLIRFEAHIFRGKAQDKARVDQFFRYNADKPWTGQEWRVTIDQPWKPIHTGNQQDEYNAFAAAQMIDMEGAHQSISMGAGQIMGFNYARIGYPSAADMYVSFRDAQMQTIGFINFFLSDPALVDAMRRKDWREIAKRYNGAGAVDTYAPLLEKAYKELAG